MAFNLQQFELKFEREKKNIDMNSVQVIFILRDVFLNHFSTRFISKQLFGWAEMKH